MRTSTIVWIVIIIAVLLGAWYLMMPQSSVSSSATPSTSLGIQGATGQTDTGQQAAAPVLTLAKSAALGDYLVAANGMTLYLYTKDTKDVSNCYNSCATAWPPYLSTAAEPLVAGTGVAGALTTVTRTDGSKQLAYKGVPLYFWVNDTKPGDTTGQNVGGVWFVVKP
ncbi:MAG: hypothetical protein WC217_00020 [Candidatus Paceibacterota bacterium]|jgi:predicted lipoprotein with Yx(FWY)xxD motif